MAKIIHTVLPLLFIGTLLVPAAGKKSETIINLEQPLLDQSDNALFCLVPLSNPDDWHTVSGDLPHDMKGFTHLAGKCENNCDKLCEKASKTYDYYKCLFGICGEDVVPVEGPSLSCVEPGDDYCRNVLDNPDECGKNAKDACLKACCSDNQGYRKCVCGESYKGGEVVANYCTCVAVGSEDEESEEV